MSDAHNDEEISDFYQYERHLPHWQLPSALHFLTLSLHDRYACNLARPDTAPIVIDALLFFHGERYELFEYTVTPDHVHLLLEPLRGDNGWFTLNSITHSMKSWSANGINAALGRRGRLWQEETFDHIVRNRRSIRRLANYIWMNPVKAGLIENPHDWPWWGRGEERNRCVDR